MKEVLNKLYKYNLNFLLNSTLSNNQITKIKAGELPATIKNLEIRANPIKEIEKDSFLNLTKLKKV
jgi:Leucine-rich repeat (LRR) protein